jgi:hypothetical protein
VAAHTIASGVGHQSLVRAPSLNQARAHHRASLGPQHCVKSIECRKAVAYARSPRRRWKILAFKSRKIAFVACLPTSKQCPDSVSRSQARIGVPQLSKAAPNRSSSRARKGQGHALKIGEMRAGRNQTVTTLK